MASPAQEITRHYGGEWHGNYGTFPAPGHSKHDRGMSVKDADDGDVLFNSFNGADWRPVKDECRSRGLLPERPRPNGNAAGPRETGHYEYADADGTVLYRTVRIEQPGRRKKFSAQRPSGKGGWIAGLGDTKRVLYRLPEVAAADPAAPVYLVEGERKADKLASWGLPATAVAFGCKGWRREYADALSGRTVVILPDNDDEGRGFADRARKDIESAGGRAVIVELPALPDKGDIIDWRGNADDLAKLVSAAMHAPSETFALIDLAAWANTDPEPRQWALDRLVPKGEVTLFTGPGGVGKSLFAQQLATCHAAAIPMLGAATAGGGVLYLTAEDDERELHWRQAHISRTLRVPIASLAGKLHLASLRGRLNNEMATFDGEGRLHAAPAYGLLKATVETTGAALVVLDNVAHLFAGNENDRGNVTAFANLLNALCRDLGITIILIGHPNKAGDDYSGSTAWLNAVRSQITLKKPEDCYDHDVRVLTLGKANYARQGESLLFRWHDFAFVRDDDLPGEMAAEIAAVAAANGDDAAFLTCLRQRNSEQRQVSEHPGPNYAPTQFERMKESKGIGKKRLIASMDRLFGIGRIERGFLYRDGSKGRDVHGLREVEATPKRSPQTLPNDFPQTPPNPQETVTNDTLPPKGGNGAASRAAAPSHSQRSTGMILAPGETGDDVADL